MTHEDALAEGGVVGRGLSRFQKLSSKDFNKLIEICGPSFSVDADQKLVHQGDRPTKAYFVEDGWVAKRKSLSTGARQTINLFLPGDFIAIRMDSDRNSLYDVATLCPAQLRPVELERLRSLGEEHESLQSALRDTQLEQETILAETLVSVGSRTAYQTLAHFLTEIYQRLERIGLASDSVMEIPLSQDQIGECVAMSNVHVSRMFTALKAADAISVKGGRISIKLNLLQDAGEYDGSHLDLATYSEGEMAVRTPHVSSKPENDAR